MFWALANPLDCFARIVCIHFGQCCIDYLKCNKHTELCVTAPGRKNFVFQNGNNIYSFGISDCRLGVCVCVSFSLLWTIFFAQISIFLSLVVLSLKRLYVVRQSPFPQRHWRQQYLLLPIFCGCYLCFSAAAAAAAASHWCCHCRSTFCSVETESKRTVPSSSLWSSFAIIAFLNFPYLHSFRVVCCLLVSQYVCRNRRNESIDSNRCCWCCCCLCASTTIHNHLNMQTRKSKTIF